MKKLLKILVLLIILLAVIAGGGLAAMKFGVLPDMLGLFPAPSTAEAPAREPTVIERLGPPPVFLPMKPIEIPVIVKGELRRRVSVRLRLQIDPESIPVIEKAGDRLHAEYFKALMDFIPTTLESRDTVDLRALKARMVEVSSRVLGPHVVLDVLIQGYYEH
ncbi:hypothetical protein CKO38_06650 [Rhodospirillum rubrum]|uniref:hypothetical protein n=1 Tax=Rhodospirillum rubrum TaxID=1085 RepID=UPI001908598B|nr:hypothetical protein [Rhodospirillum rubrum]MBK1664719.1 hypothetical protein [Rhodospirillum rubrum]MBK1676357.1 hypothetical protein [Rhodospirillum rubrum]